MNREPTFLKSKNSYLFGCALFSSPWPTCKRWHSLIKFFARFESPRCSERTLMSLIVWIFLTTERTWLPAATMTPLWSTVVWREGVCVCVLQLEYIIIIVSICVLCSIFFRPKRTVYSKKYGCDLLQYTHAPNAVIYSSNKIDGMTIIHLLFTC